MISVDRADRGVLYWVIGILITVNLGLMGWSVVVLDGKADDAAVARIERQADEIGRRDRDYLVRSQIEDLVRNGSPYVSDKPKIEDQLDKLEASVGRNEGDIQASTRSLVRIETQVAQIRETLQQARRQARRDHGHAGPRRSAGAAGVRGLGGSSGTLDVSRHKPHHRRPKEESMKALVLFHSLYGHIYKMAEAVAEGVTRVEGAEATIRRVPEAIPQETLERMGASHAQQTFAHIPVAAPGELSEYDAVIFGTPTRFGNMSGQMRTFLDQTGGLWMQGALVGKVGSVFTSSSTQHGGQESTILSFHTTLLHHGMVVVGLPYAFKGQMRMDEITGGSPYGASTIAGQNDREVSENELEAARFQGRHVAEIAKKLAA